jgi:hypothetical protein
MLDFMIISLPRSASTWAANWMTTERAFCRHDPLWMIAPDQLDDEIARLAGPRLAGIACTGLWRWPQWINRHPARKLILHRDLAQIRASLDRLGIPKPPIGAARHLGEIEGMHVDWLELFDPARAAAIWEYLTDRAIAFDQARHRELCAMRIDPAMAKVERDLALNRRLNNMDSC